MFADEMVLLGEIAEHLKKAWGTEIRKPGRKVKINANKSKVMTNKRAEKKAPFSLENETLEVKE